MATCPHSVHSVPKQILWDQPPVSFCEEGCNRTFFFCHACGEANRPLARCCRKCGEPVSFERSEAAYDRESGLEHAEQQRLTYSLISYGLNGVQALKGYKGHVFITLGNGILIFDIHNLTEPLPAPPSPPDGSPLRGVSVSQAVEDLLVTTSKSVYRLSLLDLHLDRARYEAVYSSPGPRFICHPAVDVDNQIYVLEHDEASLKSWLRRLPAEDLCSFDGVSMPPLVLPGGRLFFFTDRQVFLYDCGSRRLVERESTDLLRNTPAAFDPETGTVYVAGEEKLWRFDTESDDPALMPLFTKPFRGASIAAGHRRLFVAHLNGVSVLRSLGQIEWDSAENFITAPTDFMAPQVYGNLFTFTFLGGMGGRGLRTHLIENPGDYKTRMISDKSLLCPPLLSAGRLIAAVGDHASVELNVYDLGSSGQHKHAAGQRGPSTF